jgi:pyroglutamyl-peptidase
LIARYRPLAIVMFGLAARVPQLRVETLAQNAFSRFPDAARFSPAARHIDTRAPNRLLSRVPAHSLLHAARMHGRPILSRDAGRYLCNYVYWRALEAAAKPGGPALVVFIHVPQPRRAAAPRSRLQGARTSPRQLTAMSEAILAAAVAATRTRH